MKSTMIELVDELKKLPTTPGLELIIAEAKAGEYHDFRNKKYACGKVAVVKKLTDEARLPATKAASRKAIKAIVNDIIAGEYDEEAAPEDIENLRKEVPKNLWPAFGLSGVH